MIPIVVIDTSVLISALIGVHGPAREVLRCCLKGKYAPLISNALFHEYEDVLTRERIQNLCPLSSNEIQYLLSSFYSVCEWTPIYYLWRPNLIDENDNFLVELALAGNATYIVTNNMRDFNNSELDFPEFTIVKPEEILRGK
ncbi:MAG: putative toxin-antitoxin system toxin component, PIN family [Proteobacteria bacterium]|nr:putative toxin-antitoxin system toxin component, PIN family [Pseudomonadota bacterium]